MNPSFQQGAFDLLVKAIVLFTALPVHECAHALMASKLGDDTAKNLGRASLNPFVHLDLFGSLLMLMTGVGWAKPVPVVSRNFKKVNVKTGMALTAIAGPVSNLLMALAIMIIFKLSFLVLGLEIAALEQILLIMISLNTGLAVFNLLPVPPLDGSRLLTALLPAKLYYKVMRYERVFMLILFALLWVGVLSVPMSIMRYSLLKGMDTLTMVLGGRMFQ